MLHSLQPFLRIFFSNIFSLFIGLNGTFIEFLIFAILVTPLLGIVLLLFVKPEENRLLSFVAIGTTTLQSIFSVCLIFPFAISSLPLNIAFTFATFNLTNFSFSYALGMDGISMWFVILTSIIVNLCMIYTSGFDAPEQKRYFLLILVLSFCLINFFLASDIMLLYIYFESVLVPLFLIVILYGSRERRIHAAYQFFFYTLIGSFSMLLAIMYIYIQTNTTLLTEIPLYHFSITEQKILWAMVAFALAVKVPLVPLHIWLPEAHVEAPTVGSVILAAVVLKMGGYGIIRILLPCFPLASLYYQTFVFTICIVGMSYAAFTALRQNDIKRIIAYSSVVHMSYSTMGLFSFNVLTISSAIFGMLAHGFIAGGLFFTLGMLYDRYQSRNLSNYVALYHFSKLMSFSFFFLLLANVAFPGTANFPAELGIFIGLFDTNFLVAIFLLPALVLNGAYNIWLATRLLFGPYSTNDTIYSKANDLTLREKAVLFPIWVSVIFLGVFPGVIFSILEFPVRVLIALIV